VAQNRAQQLGIQKRFAKSPRIIRSGHPQAEHAGLLERAARMEGAGVLQGESGGHETTGAHFGPEHRNGQVPEGPAADRTVRVLWLATLQKRKRPEFLLDIAERCTDLPALFILAGRTSNESYRQSLADRAAGLGNVELRHVDSYERSWKEFENAHLYLCTSESEGFPNAFIQAWICGVPVVSLGIDPDNFISEHGLGFVCSTDDEMAQKVRLLVENAPLRERMGNEVRRVAERHFDIRSVAKDFERVLFDRKREELPA
jgi:glycosyltransferase involved in cell wall biosynthesis